MFSHTLDRPVTSVSRLSEIRMSTVVSLETLKFMAVMNKQRMNATARNNFPICDLFCHYIVSAVYALGVNGDINDKEMKVLTNLQASDTKLILLY